MYVGTLCPALPSVVNGTISFSPDMVPGFDLGTVVTYTCDQGYVLSNTSATTRMCVVQSGMTVWDGVAPTCDGKSVISWDLTGSKID